MALPKISVITVTRNSEKYLEETIKSIVSQTYQPLEYIVIDGASEDRTFEIIGQYSKRIDKWITEPDTGIADAMNKGLNLATGDYILFLHSDDYFVDDHALSRCTGYFDDDIEIVLFNLYYLDSGIRSLARPRGLNWWMNLKTGVLHQSVFCARRLFDRIGLFDTNFQITMDYDFFLRAYRAKVRSRKVDIPITVMRRTGVSSNADWQSLRKRFVEEHRIHKKNTRSSTLSQLYEVYQFVYVGYRKMIFHLGES